MEICLNSTEVKSKYRSASRKNANKFSVKYSLNKNIDFYELADKLSNKNTHNKFTNFTKFTKKFRVKNKRFPNPSDYFKKITTFNSVYCNKCNLNKYCPYYMYNRVCYFFSSSLSLPREVSDYKYSLTSFINYYLWNSSIFTQYQTTFDINFFIFLCFLLSKAESDLLKRDVSPVIKRTYKGKTTVLGRAFTLSPFIYESLSKEIEEVERRWKNLQIPIDVNSKYYPKA